MKKTKWIILILAIIILGITAITVTYYTTQHSLTLNGEEKMTIGLNAVYKEPGVKAISKGKEVSDKVKITGKLDTSSPGTYKLTYQYDTLTVTRTVVVSDKMNPEIILQQNPQGHSYLLGDEFVEPGYKAVDENGTDITSNVKVTGNNFTKAGENIVKYTVSDDKGNTTMVQRKIEVSPNIYYDTPGIPICMYHYVYDDNDPPADLNQRFGNYISMTALEEELNWLNEEGYYFPTWQEVRDYVDGKLLLPEKSIVLCFDDGSKSFLKYGIPVLEKCKVPATSFMITSNNGESKIAEYSSEYVSYESHSDNMHRPGGNVGHGGIFTVLSEEEGLADLQKSIDICGSKDAFAYPFGDYNISSRAIVEKAGFLCAVTTEYGKARPGQDPLLLPRIRMSMGQSLLGFAEKVQP